MNTLRARLVDLIEALGPISIAEYMALCLYDPRHGYYMTRDPFGRDGDFTTAPEISQMFGELVGVWVAGAWQALGAPEQVVIAEIGPGRGTLMKDMARTLAKVAPGLRDSASFNFVEVSQKLGWAQATTLEGTPGRFDWHTTVDALPPGPLIIVGNEIFDAIPIRQYVRKDGAWRERLVGLDKDDRLIFLAGPGRPDASLLPLGADNASEGAIVEIAPARAALMETIAARIATGGAGLFFDYGHLAPGLGDTLQALHRHAYDDPLTHPGESDLTSHVDFARLVEAAGAHGLETATATQGDFLLRMGLLERAGSLGAEAGEATRNRIRSEVDRLAGSDQMGELFKVLCIASPGHLPPPFRPAN